MTDTTRPDGVERAGRFRKKPVVIDAWAIDYNNTPYPEWVEAAFAKDETETGAIDWCPYGEGLYINTLEGHMQASIGDYLIRGVAGELYACRADIFATTYEPAHVAALTAPASKPSSHGCHWKDCPHGSECVHAKPAGIEVEQRQVLYGGIIRAAINLLAACQERHDTQPAPQCYGVPYGAVNALRDALEGHAKPAVGGVVDERTAFERALKETWQMVDPLRPPGTPGSYIRGEHNGAIAALATIRANFDRAALAREVK